MTQVEKKQPALLSYYVLRTVIGILGLALPIVVWLGTWALDDEPLLGSISTYYYSSTRDFFVGVLIAIGAFLATYRGYIGREETVWWRVSDNVLTNVAGLAAIGVALFPTRACEAARCCQAFQGAPWTEADWVHPVHLISAGTFFVAMGVMARFAFTKTDRSEPGAETRIRIYKGAGYVIFLCAAGMGMYGLLPDSVKAALAPARPIFVGEAVGIWAFGVAWLTKGRPLKTGTEIWRQGVRVMGGRPDSVS